MDALLQDLRHALRALRKAPGLSIVAVTTLSVAIAAFTTVFSVVNTGYLRPLPYPDSDRLVGVNAMMRGHSVSWNIAPLEIVNAVRRETKSFERVAAYDGWSGTQLADKQGAVQLMVTRVDTAILSLVGARAQRGRLLSAGEIVSGAPVAVISDSLWRTRYGNDSAIVNQVVQLDGQPHTIVGVMMPGFRFNNTSDIWVPLAERADTLPPVRADWYWLMAKRRVGVTVEQARLEIEQLGRRFATGKPADYKDLTLRLQGTIVSRSNPAYITMTALFALLAACVFVIACTNVGNLLLVRAAERRGEMAVRASLGASRGRLLRQNLAESAVLASVAGVLGAFLSWIAMRLLLASIPTQGFPSWLKFGFDPFVYSFVAGATLLAVLTVGLIPAREGARANLVDALKAGGGDSIVANMLVLKRSRRGVVIQVALAVAMFVGATLFAQSYFFLSRFDRGYDAAGVVTAHVALARTEAPNEAERTEAVSMRLREHLASDSRIGGIALAGYAEELRSTRLGLAKPRAAGQPDFRIYLPENPGTPANTLVRPSGKRLAVSDEYFQLLRIPIVRGRGFGPSDVAGGTPVAVVSERIVKLFWPGADPIGKTFTRGPTGTPFTVIGVARDVRDPTSSLADGASIEAWPNIYFTSRQVRSRPELYVRPLAPLPTVQVAIEGALRSIDASASLWTLRRLDAGEAQMLTRVFGGAVGGVAICGAFLAMIGVYGVIAYGVAQRRREIGLRVALGATSNQVVEHFARQGARFIVRGVAIGMLLALALSALIRSFVWGVSAFDPVSYGVAAVLFGGVALFAAWLPARRAASVEPLEALRSL